MKENITVTIAPDGSKKYHVKTVNTIIDNNFEARSGLAICELDGVNQNVPKLRVIHKGIQSNS